MILLLTAYKILMFSDFEAKKQGIEEIGKDAKPYSSWWNNITVEWKC
jgi:hypothetical protein